MFTGYSSHPPVVPLSPVESLQTGQVVAHAEHAHQDHWQLGGRPGEPDPGPGHHRVHLRRGRHAAVWEELPGRYLYSEKYRPALHSELLFLKYRLLLF